MKNRTYFNKVSCAVWSFVFGVALLSGCSSDNGGGAAAGPASVYTYALHTMGLVNVISESTGSVIKSIDTDVDGNGTPGDLNTNGTLGSLTPDGKKLYVSNANAGTSMRKVTVIDTTTLTKIKDIETGAVPKHGIVSPDGRWVGVNHWRREPSGKLRVSFISVANDTVYQNIDLTLKNANSNSNQSMHNAWSWDSQYFFTSSYDDDKVYVFRAPTTTGGPFTLASTFDLSVIAPDNNNPHYFAPSNDNKLMFVVTEGPSGAYAGAAPTNTPRIYVVNMDSLTLYTPLFAVLEEGEVIEGHHGNFSLDGKYFYFVNRGPGSNLTGVTVDVYDTATWELAKHIVTSGGGDGHAYLSPDGKTVVITKYGTNVLTFLDPANDWAMTDLAVGTGIHVGHITFTSDSKKAFCTNRVDGAVYQIDLSGVTPSVAKKIDLVLPNLTTVPSPIAGTGQVINSYSNIFEISGNLFKQ